MLKGYGGLIARVDLGSRKIEFEATDEAIARKFIGGVGLAAKIVWEETDEKTDPLSAESPLIYSIGPLTGTPLPKSSRYIVAGLSPLTGIWGQSHGGGSFGDEMKHAGFDAIIVKGQADRPVYLWVKDRQIEIRDASHIWGKDTYEAAEILLNETDPKASPACIGPAGEKGVKFASIISDGKLGRAAARCGFGSVMGSKRLKAVVVRGTLPIRFHDEEKFRDGVDKILRLFPLRKPDVAKEAHMRMFSNFFTLGRVPVKNFSLGSFEEGKVYVEDMRHAKQFHCRHCPYDCTESYLTGDGERHMVWEAWGPLGTNCLIADAQAMQHAYTLCNKYGMDAISIGVVVSFAMECFEKGLITKQDTGGLELRWGDSRAMVEIVRMIGEREGIGELLGEGVKRAAASIGGLAMEYAMHVKGMELPAHEPRAANGTALGYATGSIGAAHMEASGSQNLENWLEVPEPLTFPELGFTKALTRFDYEGKGAIIAKTQDFGCMLDSITVCLFLSLHQWVQPSHYAALINHAVGWDMDKDEFVLTGERIFNLKRMISVRRGISRKDDWLPPRIMEHRLKEGGTKGNLPFLGYMLNEYYAARGWSEEGIPTPETLERLGLKECISWGSK